MFCVHTFVDSMCIRCSLSFFLSSPCVSAQAHSRIVCLSPSVPALLALFAQLLNYAGHRVMTMIVPLLACLGPSLHSSHRHNLLSLSVCFRAGSLGTPSLASHAARSRRSRVASLRLSLLLHGLYTLRFTPCWLLCVVKSFLKCSVSMIVQACTFPLSCKTFDFHLVTLCY